MPPTAADHPDPEELTAYGDGEASASVVAHVAGCSICTDRAASAAQTQRAFRAVLYRFDCPSPHTLGEYELNLLETAQRVAIAAHATECDECAAELQTLRAYLAMPTEMPESMLERTRRVVASLFAPSPGLAYGGLRGAATSATRVFEAGDVTITVGPGQAPGTLIGLVVRPAAPPETLTGRAARLVAVGVPPIGELLDDLGNFEFADVAAGLYELEVDLDDRVIVIEQLHID